MLTFARRDPTDSMPAALRVTGLGQEEPFPPTMLGAGYGFRKETIAGMRPNGRDAPIADHPGLAFPTLRRGIRMQGEGELNNRDNNPLTNFTIDNTPHVG